MSKKLIILSLFLTSIVIGATPMHAAGQKNNKKRGRNAEVVVVTPPEKKPALTTEPDVIIIDDDDDTSPAGAGSGAGASSDVAASSSAEALITPPADTDFSYGLINYCGNDCFINATVQCIFSNPSHLNYLYALFSNPDIEKNIRNLPEPDALRKTILQAIVRSTKALFIAYLHNTISSETMRNFTQALRAGFDADEKVRDAAGQGSADEAYLLLMNTLAMIDPSNRFPMLNERSARVCSAGHRGRARDEEHRVLQLAIPNQRYFVYLSEQIDAYQEAIPLIGANKLACTSCGITGFDTGGNPNGQLVDGSEKRTLLPVSCLVINCKRFHDGSLTSKVRTPVIPGERIELGGNIYHLTGVAIHRGATRKSGHWIAWKRGIIFDYETKLFKNNGLWHEANDTAISPLITTAPSVDNDLTMFFYEQENPVTCPDNPVVYRNFYDFMVQTIETIALEEEEEEKEEEITAKNDRWCTIS
jgi:hypothetical protein